MFKFSNKKVLFLLVVSICMMPINMVFAAKNNTNTRRHKVNKPRKHKRPKPFSLGAKKGASVASKTEQVVNTINNRQRRNSQLLDGVQKEIIYSRNEADKGLKDIKDLTEEAAQKITKKIENHHHKVSRQMGVLAIVLTIIIVYTYYNDYLKRLQLKPVTLPKYMHEKTNILPLFSKKKGSCKCPKDSMIKCTHKFIIMILFLITAIITLWRRFFKF